MEDQERYVVGRLDDDGKRYPIDSFRLSIFAYGWAVEQEGRCYYEDTETQQLFRFRNGRPDIDLFQP